MTPDSFVPQFDQCVSHDRSLAKVIELRFHEQKRRVNFNRWRMHGLYDTPFDSKYCISVLVLSRVHRDTGACVIAHRIKHKSTNESLRFDVIRLVVYL